MDTERGFTLIELMIVIAIIAIIAAIAIPDLLAARKSANETSAVGALRTVGSSQQVFRDTGKGPVPGRYAHNYTTLADPDGTDNSGDELLGEVFDDAASVTKAGYGFGTIDTSDGDFTDPINGVTGVEPTDGDTNFKYGWESYASPVDLGNTGDRFFYASHAGDILFAVSPDGTSPPDDYDTTPADWQAID